MGYLLGSNNLEILDSDVLPIEDYTIEIDLDPMVTYFLDTLEEVYVLDLVDGVYLLDETVGTLIEVLNI
jgi:hypothetical protein